MRQLLFICLLLLPCAALAQDHPKAEFFAGYSYVRAFEEDIDLTQFGTPGVATRRDADLNGFNFAINYNPVSWFGIVGDIGGAYGRADYVISSPFGTTQFRAGTKVHTFLFGPQISGRAKKVTVFGRGLAGVARLDQSSTIQGQNITGDETSFSYGAGGGLDIRASDTVSIRAIQADVIWTRFGNSTQRNLRLSTGVVFRNKE
ncbi:MAG: outer membrane protein [Blastocatellia bacterium]